MNYFWMNSVYFISQVLYIDGVCVVSYPAAICWSFFFCLYSLDQTEVYAQNCSAYDAIFFIQIFSNSRPICILYTILYWNVDDG